MPWGDASHTEVWPALFLEPIDRTGRLDVASSTPSATGIHQEMSMNLVNKTSHASKLGFDELVPSRYALRIGEIDVLVISDGVLPLPTTTMSTNAEPAARTAWLDEMFLPRDAFDWALNVAVVRSGDRTILIDSGVGAEFPAFPRAGQSIPRLEAAGIDLASVTDIVITHMHMDHVGGLLGEGVKERLRTDLRIHVAEAEVEFWESPDFSRTVMPSPIPDVLRSVAGRFANEYRSRLQTFAEEVEVAPGVFVRRTGGHTPGHSVVCLASGGERLTFAGDAIFPVGFDHPDWQNGFEHDPEESVRVRVRLLREVAASGALLAAAHLPFPSICRVAVEGDAFRCVPAFWDY
jgi:glyoxylase-like metal-dependent hydrolase (beta-lactamase superfamily II)